MAYRAIVIEYSPKAEDMAARIEKTANEMEKEGYELVTFSVTGPPRRSPYSKRCPRHNACSGFLLS
jgi:hypothetical protein